MNKERLEILRKEIDALDGTIVKALGERMRTVREVGALKRAAGIVPLDKDRWQQVLDSRKAQARREGVPEALVEEIYETIHRFALMIEEENKTR